MALNTHILATIEFLATEYGGRKTPVSVKLYRCPMLIKGEYHDCALDLEKFVPVNLGERKDDVPIEFLRRDLLAGRLQLGDVFALKELNFVAIGHVTQVFI